MPGSIRIAGILSVVHTTTLFCGIRRRAGGGILWTLRKGRRQLPKEIYGDETVRQKQKQQTLPEKKCLQRPEGCSTLFCEAKQSATNPNAMGADLQCLEGLLNVFGRGCSHGGVIEKDTMASEGIHTVIHNTSHLGDSYARQQVRGSSGAI